MSMSRKSPRAGSGKHNAREAEERAPSIENAERRLDALKNRVTLTNKGSTRDVTGGRAGVARRPSDDTGGADSTTSAERPTEDYRSLGPETNGGIGWAEWQVERKSLISDVRNEISQSRVSHILALIAIVVAIVGVMLALAYQLMNERLSDTRERITHVDQRDSVRDAILEYEVDSLKSSIGRLHAR